MSPQNTIVAVITSPGLGGFFFDDQKAIKAGAERDGATYRGTPVTPGFAAVREPSQSVSVQLILDDGYIAYGDCASVQYTGVGGREPRFQATELARRIDEHLTPQLIGLDVTSFRKAAHEVEQLTQAIPGLGRAVAYGLSQAILDAAAHAAGHHLMAQVVRDEWNIASAIAEVPIYSQCGDDRYDNVDKMILKRVPVLPHGLINTRELVGHDGEALESYVRWITSRIKDVASDPDYLPVLHLDVYGQIGAVANGDTASTADILERLEAAARPHALRIEHPLHALDRNAQIVAMGELHDELRRRGSAVELIADEWANTAEDIHEFAIAGVVDLIQIKTPDLGSIHNTIDAILDCQALGIGAVLGGTCAETDRSARTTVHIGIATGVTQMLAKPGMGVDEGLMIVANEMQRALALSRYRDGTSQEPTT